MAHARALWYKHTMPTTVRRSIASVRESVVTEYERTGGDERRRTRRINYYDRSRTIDLVRSRFRSSSLTDEACLRLQRVTGLGSYTQSGAMQVHALLYGTCRHGTLYS